MAKSKNDQSVETSSAKACAVSRADFRKNAKALNGSVNDTPIAIAPKEFKTGTLGWFANGSTIVMMDGVPVKATFMVQLFIPHSQEAK